MEYKYEGNSLKSGIYKITNKLNGRIYIGSAKEFKNRWVQHTHSLRNKKHSNKFLQSDFNKCGEEAFIFEVIEVTEDKSREERLSIEEVYIKKFFDNGDNCYNLCDRAISREGYSSSTPEQTSKKISIALKNRWSNVGEKEKLSERMKKQWQEKGRKEKYSAQIISMWVEPDKRCLLLKSRRTKEFIEGFKKRCHTTESINKMAVTNTKNHGLIISPEGKIFEVIGLKAFCELHNLPKNSIQNIHHLMKGKLPSYYGWRKYTPDIVGIPYTPASRAKSFALISPEGDKYTGTNIAEFCRTHDLYQQNIVKVLLGKRKSHKGWRRFLEPDNH